MKRDVQENDEEAVQVKEQSILELGSLLAKTGQAEGEGGSGWGVRVPGAPFGARGVCVGIRGVWGLSPTEPKAPPGGGGGSDRAFSSAVCGGSASGLRLNFQVVGKRVNGGEKIAGCSSRWLLHCRCAEVPQLCCLFCFLPSQSWGGS